MPARRQLRALFVTLIIGRAVLPPLPIAAQLRRFAWNGFAGNAQHAAVAGVAAQPLSRIRWQMPVDLNPQYTSGGALLIHYGSPLISKRNTVIVPVKVGATDGFQVEGRDGNDGTLLWTLSTDYRLPPHDWVPSFSPTLARSWKLWIPGAGGSVYLRTHVDRAAYARIRQVVFYGTDAFDADPDSYRSHVYINTPITADKHGNIFFGFQVTGPTPLNLQSGIARISHIRRGRWVAATTAAGDAQITKVAHNSAPALSNDHRTLYVAVNSGDGSGAGAGYLLALDSRTLATIATVRLKDPHSGGDAVLHDDGTASPTVAPDGDVYFGVVENPFGSNNGRGWLLHFDALLQPKGVPGAFGWDDTASIVPASMVPSYQATSSYFLMTKYNNYAGVGGDGVNRIAVLDPNDQMIDPHSGTPVMREILTVAGPTPDDELRPDFPNAVREWCINAAAVDPITGSIIANNEDGVLYRWDLTTATLSESLVLTPGIGAAYTPTVIGGDGTVYAINNGTLFAVGR